jgi:hypothetical protein
MGQHAEFLTGLFTQGVVMFPVSTTFETHDDVASIAILHEAYETARFDLAGPMIHFEQRIALEASKLVRRILWAVANHSERPEVLEKILRMSRAAATPGDHFSADLTFRFLPGILHRLRSMSPNDVLVSLMVKLLLNWPLSGVMADIYEPPGVALDFQGHQGLAMLYGERLAQNDRENWWPNGRGREYAELVFEGLGRKSQKWHAKTGVLNV